MLAEKHAREAKAYFESRIPGIRFKPTESPAILTAVLPVGETTLSRNVSKKVFLDPREARRYFADWQTKSEEYEADLIGYEVVDAILFGKVEQAPQAPIGKDGMLRPTAAS